MEHSAGHACLHVACGKAIEWQAARPPEEVMQQREEMITQLELADEQLRSSGKCAHWFSKCDEVTKKVSCGVNGFLLQELLRASHHSDLAAADLFRDGTCLLCHRAGVVLCSCCGRSCHAG